MSDKDVDNVYLDLTLENNRNNFAPIRYDETRAKSILDNPSKYKLKVVSLYLNSGGLPLFKFKENAYIITITTALGADVQGVVPKPTGPILPTASNERFVFSVFSFLEAINRTFADIYTTIGAGGAPPILRFDEDFGRITLLKEENDQNQIFFNYELGYYFLNLNYDSVNLTFGAANGKDVQFLFPPYTTIELANGNIYLINAENYSRVPYWSNLNKIYITSNSLSCRSTNLGFESTSNGSSNDGIPRNRNIITSFYPSAKREPNGPYLFKNHERDNYIDLLGNIPLRKFDFQIYGQNFDGDIFNISLLPGTICNLKLHFVKRDFLVNSSS